MRHPTPKRRLILVAVILIAAFYCLGYLWLRTQHHFVRDATYYTDDAGRLVRTDWVGLGEWRDGYHWRFVGLLYLPCRAAESCYWRWRG